MTTETETAILAGGCFWGMQDLIRKRPGVISSRVGYTGGHTDDPSYESVCTHTTGHAETVRPSQNGLMMLRAIDSASRSLSSSET